MNRILVTLSAVILLGCSQQKTQTENNTDIHNAENSLDYHGVYRDTVPASDNTNMIIILNLSPDNNFLQQTYYLAKEDSISQVKGTYVVTGNILELTSEDGRVEQMFIEEGRLRMLDAQKNKLPDNYTLQKEYLQ